MMAASEKRGPDRTQAGNKWYRPGAAYALLSAFVLAHFYPVLSAGLILVERDLSTYFIPPRYLWVRFARSLTFPLWNPHNYSGIPLLATLQPGVLYPPHVLYLFLPFNLVWNWLIILHYLFAGLTTYLLLRHLKATETASCAGAAAFLFSGYLLSLHSLVTHLFAVSWFPLVVLYFFKYLDTSRNRHLVLAALCLCMVFLAGAPEVLFMTILVLILLVVFGPAFSGTAFTRYRGLRAFCLLGALTGLLSAVQLLPFLELKSMSIRKGGLSYWEATLWSFGFRDFIQFFIDDAFGAFRNLGRYWENQAWLKSVYTGIIPFVLSVFFFLSKDRRRVFFLTLMLLSLMLALGGNLPLYRLLYRVPPFDDVRYPVKFLFLFVFALSLTAGLGYDRLKAGSEAGDGRTGAAVRITFLSGFFFALLWASLNLFHDQVYHFLDVHGFKPDRYNVIEDNLHNLKRFLLFSFLSSSCLLVYFRTRRSSALYALALLLISDLFLANFGNFRTTPWNTYVTPPQFAGLVGGPSSDRYFVEKPAADEFYAYPHNRAVIAPAYAGVFGLYSVSGSEVMKVAYQEAFCDLIRESASLERARKLLGAGGIRYVVSLKPTAGHGFRPLLGISAKSAKRPDKQIIYLHEYEDSPGRTFLVGRGRFIVSDADTTKALLEKESSDVHKEVLISGPAPGLVDNGQVSGSARFTGQTPNRLAIRYTSDRDCFLYLSDTYYPGWRAYVDGKRTPVYRANLAFRAIQVPKGTHDVTFRYVPMSFYGGLALTLAGMGLSAFLLIRERKRG